MDNNKCCFSEKNVQCLIQEQPKYPFLQNSGDTECYIFHACQCDGGTWWCIVVGNLQTYLCA